MSIRETQHELLVRMADALDAQNALTREAIAQHAAWQEHIKRLDEELLDLRRKAFERDARREQRNKRQEQFMAELQSFHLNEVLQRMQHFPIDEDEEV